jgi:YHS domain-containing protein
VGLRGYSPVSLFDSRRWVQGNKQLTAEYKGVAYQMASRQELNAFRESPDRYAPQVLGCDPVILDVTDRAVPGDIRFAAFFDGELYLFVSEKSRHTFQEDPERFVRTKHVLKVDELDDKRLR